MGRLLRASALTGALLAAGCGGGDDNELTGASSAVGASSTIAANATATTASTGASTTTVRTATTAATSVSRVEPTANTKLAYPSDARATELFGNTRSIAPATAGEGVTTWIGACGLIEGLPPIVTKIWGLGSGVPAISVVVAEFGSASAASAQFDKIAATAPGCVGKLPAGSIFTETTLSKIQRLPDTHAARGVGFDLSIGGATVTSWERRMVFQRSTTLALVKLLPYRDPGTALDLSRVVFSATPTGIKTVAEFERAVAELVTG